MRSLQVWFWDGLPEIHILCNRIQGGHKIALPRCCEYLRHYLRILLGAHRFSITLIVGLMIY